MEPPPGYRPNYPTGIQVHPNGITVDSLAALFQAHAGIHAAALTALSQIDFTLVPNIERQAHTQVIIGDNIAFRSSRKSPGTRSRRFSNEFSKAHREKDSGRNDKKNVVKIVTGRLRALPSTRFTFDNGLLVLLGKNGPIRGGAFAGGQTGRHIFIEGFRPRRILIFRQFSQVRAFVACQNRTMEPQVQLRCTRSRCLRIRNGKIFSIKNSTSKKLNYHKISRTSDFPWKENDVEAFFFLFFFMFFLLPRYAV